MSGQSSSSESGNGLCSKCPLSQQRSSEDHRRFFALVSAAFTHWPAQHDFTPDNVARFEQWLSSQGVAVLSRAERGARRFAVTASKVTGLQFINDFAQMHASLAVTQRIAAGIRTTHETTNRAREAYVTAQRIAEAAAVEVAKAMGGTAEEVEARGLAALRGLDDARRPVLAAFAVAYSALARAESLMELVEAGKRDPTALMLAAMEVARAAEAVYAAVRAGGK